MKRQIEIDIEQARKWYDSEDPTLRELALSAFTEDEINVTDYTQIKCVADAYRVMNIPECDALCTHNKFVAVYGEAAWAMAELRLVVAAIRKTAPKTNYTYIPRLELCDLNENYLFKVQYADKLYGVKHFPNVMLSASNTCNANLLFGCPTSDSANHLVKYFSKLIVKSLYSDSMTFKILD